MNENITVLILGDQTFSKLTYAYCQLSQFFAPMDALYNVYGKVEIGESDMNTVQNMVNYMKAQVIDLATAIEP